MFRQASLIPGTRVRIRWCHPITVLLRSSSCHATVAGRYWKTKETTIQRFTAIGLIAILTATLAACSDSRDTSQDAATATAPAPVAPVVLSPAALTKESVGVEVNQFKYSSAVLEITTGTTVTWTNTDQILHTVTTGTPDAPDGQIDGQMPAAGTSFSFTFTEPGNYDYFCSRHTFMTGTVIVQ